MVVATQTGGVTVKVVNGTTGAAGDAERVELREFGAEMRLVVSAGSTRRRGHLSGRRPVAGARLPGRRGA